VPQDPPACTRPDRRRLLLGGAALLAGCADTVDHDAVDAPMAAPLPRVPRIAWVFGSGGPRGFVHVGVIKALAELQLVPDVIVGASVGALVGTLYAGGVSAAEVQRLAIGLQPWRLLSWSPFHGKRFGAPALARFVNEQIDGRLLQQLPVPMVCAVQRLRDHAVLGFSRGDAGIAVQASAAIEGRFVPVTIRGERYADADRVMPLPVRLARSLGAVRVLAVDASAHEERAPPGAEAYRETDLLKRELTRPDAEAADVLLHPDFGYWVSLSRDFRERVIAVGYKSTMARAAELRALHGA
jgi:NTE family protein